MKTVFISYSSHQLATAKRVESFFNNIGYSPRIDKTILTPGEDFRTSLLEEVAKADIFILLISHQSVESDFVHSEVEAALERISDLKESGAKFLIAPILIHPDIRTDWFPPLRNRFHWEEMLLPEDDVKVLSKIVQKTVVDLPGQEHSSVCERLEHLEMGGKLVPDYQRIQDLVSATLKKELSPIRDAIWQQEKILTPTLIAEIEERVQSDVLVITKHLENDTRDPTIREKVLKNMKRKDITYRYLLVDYVDDVEESDEDNRQTKMSAFLRRRLQNFIDYFHGENKIPKEKYSFFVTTFGLFMPASEIVIYDSLHSHIESKGYFELDFRASGIKDKRELFHELPNHEVVQMIRLFERRKGNRFAAVPIDTFIEEIPESPKQSPNAVD